MADSTQKKTIVYIDGENFLHRVEDVLKSRTLIQKKEEIIRLDITTLFQDIFPEYQLELRYYGTKIRTHDITDPTVLDRAKVMVESQRRLKRNLENQGCAFIISGSLRLRQVTCSSCQKTSHVFKEKGVDVRQAVDIAEEAGEGVCQIIVSSDSDLLPALHAARAKGSHLIYVHHAEQPNFAMIKAAGETRVFTPAQIVAAYQEVENE